jgi:Transcriptional regulator LmrA/YxaF-like, C-terminal domain
MSRYFCHEHPEVLAVVTRVVDARPGAVVLGDTPFHPGGGGQLADQGVLRWSGGEVRVGPLNNLAQKMSAADEGFQQRIARLYRRWEAGVARALQRGQTQGSVRGDVDVAAAGTFIVASIEGALGLAKTRKDRAPLRACAEGLTRYLETLRPMRRLASATPRRSPLSMVCPETAASDVYRPVRMYHGKPPEGGGAHCAGRHLWLGVQAGHRHACHI